VVRGELTALVTVVGISPEVEGLVVILAREGREVLVQVVG